jgi:hypothetical protein
MCVDAHEGTAILHRTTPFLEIKEVVAFDSVLVTELRV